LGWKIQVFDTDGSPQQSQKIRTSHQQYQIETLLTQNFFSAKSIYKCVMVDESYFTVDGNECQQQSYYESKDHPATDDVKFIPKTKFPAKVSESGIRDSIFFKASLAVNKEVYISKCVPVLHKFIQKHHKNEKIVFWPDLASAHYANDTLIRPIEIFWAKLKRKVYSTTATIIVQEI
jgi:hypothetical protein